MEIVGTQQCVVMWLNAAECVQVFVKKEAPDVQ
jgi:hypothetical protein